MRNHTANSFDMSVNTSANTSVNSSVNPLDTTTIASHPSSTSRKPFGSALLLGSLAAGIVGTLSFFSTAPQALAADPVLPQAYSAKLVDTATLSTPTLGAPTLSTPTVAPVVSMLPPPATKVEPTASVAKKAKKAVRAVKAKKLSTPATTTTTTATSDATGGEAQSAGVVALALPVPKANSAKSSKSSTLTDTKAPVVAQASSENSSLDAAFAALRKCESGGNYKIATGNGYYGAYQFDPRTWRSLGYTGLPSDAAPEVQDEAARKLLAKAGWGQWPACSRKLGLR